MATDVTLSHTIDDDITFERVRHMPRRTQFVSNHRKLSWQYDKQMKQHERDRRLSHVEMSRAKTAMAEKLKYLQDVKRQMEMKRTSSGGRAADRRSSAPCVPDTVGTGADQTGTTDAVAAPMNPWHSVPSLAQSEVSTMPEVATIPEIATIPQVAASPEVSELGGAKQDGRVRTVVVVAKGPVAQHPPRTPGRRATIAEGATERSGLPEHLVRRLSQFMDSTSSLLMAPPSSRQPEGVRQQDSGR